MPFKRLHRAPVPFLDLPNLANIGKMPCSIVFTAAGGTTSICEEIWADVGLSAALRTINIFKFPLDRDRAVPVAYELSSNT